MIADALAGKIDLIVTKSVSRFARNTVDSLTTIRKLKDKGVECYFEKENIWTFDSKGELLITIMSSLAQEESRSISENCTWGQRKRFADGKVTVPFSRFLGYDRGPNGELVINKEQAETVKLIYRLFLQGQTYHNIAKTLMEKGIKSPGGKDKWNPGTIKNILSNEKYKGDALLQKTYITDFLTKKPKVNEGEIPQYYVEGDHEAIITPETFDAVQREIDKRGKGKKYHSGVHPFSSKIKCGECGSWYGSKVWHSNSKYRRVIWQCNHKYGKDKHCSTPHLTDDEIKAAFLSAVNKLLADKDAVIQNGKEMSGMLFDTAALEKERDDLLQEVQVVADMVQKYIYENAHVALDQESYQKKYDSLTARYEAKKQKLQEVTEKISQLKSQKGNVEDFLKAFEKAPDTLTEFSLDAFTSLVDYITVYSRDDIRVTFRNVQEIKA
jgi:site-specific DNA recombinase